MTCNELILINSDKVRRDSNLMAFYIECFTEAFGYKPKCTGCTFSSDWNKLVRFINKGETITVNQKQNTMSSFKLKKTTNTILAYKINGRTYRKYDNRIDEDFAITYLTNGTEAEIEQRKKLFAVLPDLLKTKAISDEEAAETLRIDLESNEVFEDLENLDVTENVTENKIFQKKKRVSKKNK